MFHVKHFLSFLPACRNLSCCRDKNLPSLTRQRLNNTALSGFIQLRRKIVYQDNGKTPCPAPEYTFLSQ